MLRTIARRALAPRAQLQFSIHTYRRCIHASHLDPSIRDFTLTMARKQPTFSISPECIRVLSEPSHFYENLLDMIRRAERRIFISSLYIGSAESELISELDKALRANPSLKLYLQLDLNRSTRPGPSSTTKILLPLLRDFPSQVHVSMFRSPSLRGVLARIVPPRFNEGWGTWHAKIYGADDDVMISGANLNKSYFTNRQDRYLHITSQKKFSQYCFDFLQTVSGFSFKLLPSTSTPSPSNSTSQYSYAQEGYTLHWPDAQTHPHHIHSKAESALIALQSSYIQPSTVNSSSSSPSPETLPHNAILFPIIQAGQFNIREEETTFQLLYRQLNSMACELRSRLLLDLTSGYFSLYKPYQNLILGSPNVDCRIVAASPKANGFFGSNGVSGRIPEGYTLHEQRFMSAVKRAGKLWKKSVDGAGHGVQLSEWEKKGWTYHAKGIWLSPSASSRPILTLFGSTNLNARSAHLDTELSFLMVIPSETAPSSSTSALSDSASSGEPSTASPGPASSLRDSLAREIEGIRANAAEWQGDRRKVRFTTKIIVWLVKGML